MLKTLPMLKKSRRITRIFDQSVFGLTELGEAEVICLWNKAW
ncbi:hypothetical protein [Noviherbaspirillum malthae]|jgi:hypothetical protein|nr:hypothetical protein [Noviherbaspirillum malthae]